MERSEEGLPLRGKALRWVVGGGLEEEEEGTVDGGSDGERLAVACEKKPCTRPSITAAFLSCLQPPICNLFLASCPLLKILSP